MADKVTATKYVRTYYKNGSTYEYKSQSYSDSESLSAGGTYTPSASSHLPKYPPSGYTLYKITLRTSTGQDVTSGSITCPSDSFNIYYHYYANAVTLTNYYKYYRGSILKSSTTSTDTVLANYTYTPSSHQPSYDSSIYSLESIVYQYGSTTRTVTSGSITTPSGAFSLTYTYKGSALVDKWSWSASNGSATASQTSAAYSAVTGKGKTSAFSYLVWNDMVDKAKEILDESGGSWSTSGERLPYANTLMTSSDKEMTAARFNSLRYNIGLHYKTGITDRSAGDIIYGSYFVTLASCLNGWIDSL